MTCQSCGYHGEGAVCPACRNREAIEDRIREHPLSAREGVAIILENLEKL